MKTKEKRRLVFGGILFFAASVLQVLARFINGFGEWYATRIYPFFVGTVSRFFSLFSFSVIELFLYFLLFGLIAYIIFAVIQIIFKQGNRFISSLTWCWCAISAMLFVYTLTCGINYYRQPFSAVSDFKITSSNEEDLIRLSHYLKDQINLAAKEIRTDILGNSILPEEMEKEAKASMGRLGIKYPSLAGYYPRPKGLLVSKTLSVQQLSGIYSPFTVEANYNREMPPYNIPVTACHELSHLKGFMREDEANFIAYLACIGSDVKEFNYSGYLLAFIYSTNALYETGDKERYSEIYNQLCDTAKRDLEANSIYWAQYDGKVAEAANQINDTYLKANNQYDGVKSYGRMVDLLLADYKQKLESSSVQ